MFVVMTLLMPVLMGAAIILPSFLMARGLGEKNVAVLDGTGQLQPAFTRTMTPEVPDVKQSIRRGRRSPELPQTLKIDYVDAHGETNIIAAAKPYLDRLNADRRAANRLDAVFVIPRDTTSELRLLVTAPADGNPEKSIPVRFHVTDIGLGEAASATDNFVSP